MVSPKTNVLETRVYPEPIEERIIGIVELMFGDVWGSCNEVLQLFDTLHRKCQYTSPTIREFEVAQVVRFPDSITVKLFPKYSLTSFDMTAIFLVYLIDDFVELRAVHGSDRCFRYY